MKLSFRITALATMVAGLALLTPAMHAQINAHVSVPFAFDYGSKHFGPGAYTLTMDGPDTLIIHSGTNGATAIVQLAIERTRPATSEVIFKRYGNRYFLQEVVIAGGGQHVTVNESDAERRVDREFAMRGSGPTPVALALLPEGSRGN